ncbi:copper resistance protein CopC [Aeromicrobium marinum DSM 15272]|uniref:Copper resistance protein CopC n=1 Tax=Aeromicrobium marinum DSM 15272 TaxID=585531 RepID=E2SFQ0_9ACTN|nr:copper resistance CopC family protein [Aeromicrobium marinum]EFQ82017.1 copper resistance protein CopC [Aeromicrobium marinum DSM 15272]
MNFAHRACFAVGVLALLLAPLPAAADAALVGSTPTDGSAVVDGAPPIVSFEFSEDVFEGAAFLAVIDPEGTEVSTGDVSVDGRTLQRGYAPTGPGTYTASYRIVSTDGHPVEGSITFTSEGLAVEDDPTSSPQEAPAPAGQDGSITATADSDDASLLQSPLTWAAVALVAATTVVWLLVARRRRPEPEVADVDRA